MPNQTKGNKLVDLIAVRAAENAAYLTVGSKAYFKDQLIGKRNGQTYGFVVRDAGVVEQGLELGADTDRSVVERQVDLTLEPWHVAVETNSIETVTDMDWDSEIAEPNGKKLSQALVKNYIAEDLGKVGAAFVGEGFLPLSQAGGYLKSVSDDEVYGFVDPQIEAILTSNGQQFQPVGAPDMYSKGLLGKFHEVEYRAQRFFPNVKVSEGLVDLVNDSTVASYTDNNDGTATIEFTVPSGSAPAADVVIPKGGVFWIDGVMACDLIGDETTEEKAWVAIEDDVVTSGSDSWELTVRSVDATGKGTREVNQLPASGDKVACPEAGAYRAGVLRANGSFEFETLDKLEAAGADYSKVNVEGLTLHENKIVDLSKMINTTRWDTVVLAGVVEPRSCAYVLVK